MRGNGERIGPQNLPTSSIAGGVWNLLNQQRAQQRGAWPSATPAVVTDPYFMYVPLLLNTTSTNAQQNNTFLDSSSNAFTITRNGTPTQGAFTPYQPSGYWSGYFNGTSDYLSIANNAALQLASSAWTIEGWFYIASGSGTDRYLAVQENGFTDPTTNWALRLKTTNVVRIVVLTNIGTTASFVDGTTTINLNTWYHIAASCDGTGAGANLRLWVNGNYEGGTTFNSSQLNVNAAPTKIMAWPAASSYTSGYASNFRIVKGTAVYTGTSAITVPTTPLTAITNTSLLTCQSNRFIDNSTNAFAITVNGTPKVQAFQPFAPAASYSAATYGGSGYFNGTSDYLSLAASSQFSLTGSFTVECSFYITSNPPNDNNGLPTAALAIYWSTSLTGSQGFEFNITTGASGSITFTKAGSATGISANYTSFALNTWYHVAVTYNGTTGALYLNGTSLTLSANNWAWTIPSGTPILRVGGSVFAAGYNHYFPGYISNFRIVNGSAIAPPAGGPTAPVTAVSGTSLLTNFTNAGIYDAAWQNNALTVGDAQASTTQYKWSPTSMKFDGTGDYLTVPNNSAFAFGTGDFTIECWVYLNASKDQAIVDTRSSGPSTTGIALAINSSNYPYIYVTGATLFTSSTALSNNTWTYLAVVKSSNTITLYINGVKPTTGSGTSTTNLTDTSLTIAGIIDARDTTATYKLNGYIQDLRITKGVARTITTPTAAFPTR